MKIAVVGFGNRGQLFAEYVLDSADAELTAIADCNESAREKAQNEYKLAPQNCYESADEFFAQGKCADAVFICTQDSDHKAHTIKAMQLGYDVCLEKPIATKMQDCEDIYAAQQATGRKVMICHVLRYSHFYGKLRQMIKSGEIGDVVTISQTENVGYWARRTFVCARGLEQCRKEFADDFGKVLSRPRYSVLAVRETV